MGRKRELHECRHLAERRLVVVTHHGTVPVAGFILKEVATAAAGDCFMPVTVRAGNSVVGNRQHRAIPSIKLTRRVVRAADVISAVRLEQVCSLAGWTTGAPLDSDS